MTFVNPQYLVGTDWLETHLTDPDLRVLDCTVLSDVDRRWPYLESGRETWAQGHIPGSGFVDLMSELADQESPLPFMMPPATQFAEVMSRYGVGDGTRVVLYDAEQGYDGEYVGSACLVDVAGLRLRPGRHIERWLAQVDHGRAPHLNRAVFLSSRPLHRSATPGAHGRQTRVLAAIGDSSTCLINALTAEEHAGTIAYYGRPGRIPSSVNIPTIALVDPVTHAYLPAEQLRAKFAAVGAAQPRPGDYLLWRGHRRVQCRVCAHPVGDHERGSV